MPTVDSYIDVLVLLEKQIADLEDILNFLKQIKNRAFDKGLALIDERRING